jgi:NAD(P)-dependent dehydrogenase (short-subunit alcohol dehydrogenase family)
MQHAVLAGKVAVVVGGSRGIGAAAAVALAHAGAKVVIAARDVAALDLVSAQIRTSGGEAHSIPTDARDPAQLRALIEWTVARFGRLDAAFNNAGSGHMPAPFADLTIESFDEALSLNLRATFVAMKLEIEAMLATGGGSIVNMSSTAGLAGVRGMGGYAAAKHGVIGLTRSAALDYAARGIRVNVVAPGPILTDRLRALPDERRAPIVAAVPMGRIGTPEEVAAAVVWLCSGASSFVTGVVLPVDGGRLAGA